MDLATGFLTALPGVRVTDLKEIEQILDVFQAHGHNEVSLTNRSL